MKNNLKYIYRICCFFILVGFTVQASIAQKNYAIIYWKVMNLDKTVKPIQGMGYYINGNLQSGGGKIIITDKYISIAFQIGYGDPDIIERFIRIDKREGKTVYYTTNSQLTVFPSKIHDFKKEQQIIFERNFDNTLQLFSIKYVFQTITNLNEAEQINAENKLEKEQAEKLKEEKKRVKTNILDNYVFDGKDLSICAEFIGRQTDLLDFYKKNPENRISLSLMIDEYGNVHYQQDRGYDKPDDYDTILLTKILKFNPAKIIFDKDTFLVKSGVVFSFLERNGDGIHFSPLTSITGIIKKKSNTIQIISTEPAKKEQIIIDNINLDKAFVNKKNGNYQFKFNTLKLNVDIFIYDKGGRYCHSIITNEIEVIKSIVEFYGQNEIWGISF